MSQLLRKIRQRFGIAARPMTVRTHVALHWRLLGLVLVGAVALGGAWWLYGAAQRFAGFDREALEGELADLRRRASELESETARLRAVADASGSTLRIEQTAQAELKAQLRRLEDENARLREDVSFFETLIPSGAKDEKLAIHGLRVAPDAMPGEYRYRMLVTQGSATPRDREFQGTVQLVVELQREGRSAILTLPDERGGNVGDAFKLAFKRFRRVEGVFRIEPGAAVRAVQVRILESGAREPRATQTFRLDH
ncbi:MAG: hypothetical protein MUF79_11195 [Burkholderiales bacterium]|nr:hypothetical protein [Burkholderiales bacterium]